MNFSFESFVNGSFDYDKATQTHSCLWLREEKMDIGGGTISIEDIDKLKDYPDTDVVTISGLNILSKHTARSLRQFVFSKISLLKIGLCLARFPTLNIFTFLLISAFLLYGI